MSGKFCESCGAALADGAKFCNECGKITAISTPPPPPPVAVPAQPAYTPPSQPAPSPAAVNTIPHPQAASQAASQTPSQPYAAQTQNYAAPPQQPYYPPVPQQGFIQKPQNTEPMRVGQYIGTMIISAIPLVGFIMLLVWAFGSDTNINKKNYARAVLILSVIGVVLGIIFSAVIGAAISALFNSSGGYYY